MRLLQRITPRSNALCSRAAAITIIVCGLSLPGLPPASAQQSAGDKNSYQKSLSDVSLEIKNVAEKLNKNRSLLASEKDKLAALEQRMAALGEQRAGTQKLIDEQRQELAGLEQQLQQLTDSQTQNKALLEALILHRYKSGSPNYLKLLLNQENPFEVGRLSHYYRYFSQAQQEQLSVLSEQLEAVQNVRRQATAKSTELAATEQRLESESQSLQSLAQQRAQRIAALDGEVTEDAEKLQNLEADRARLNNLLTQIAEQAKKLRELEEQRRREETARQTTQNSTGSRQARPKRPLVAGGFRKQRGRLEPPVKASLAYGFGSRLAQSGMPAQGHFYNTDDDEEVVSVFRGRVLFSDYLKGYGLLLIIDHGDEHISLYGHNELLYKRVGDSVETGEVVARSGVSGGLKRPGLYFEIRHNAVPVDPKNWLND